MNNITASLKSIHIVIAASILALSLLVCAGIGGFAAYKIKASADVIEVTGSARIPVQADFGRWPVSLETKTGMTDQQTGYDRLEQASQRIVSYLKEQGFTDIETPAPNSFPNYVYPQNSEQIQTGYTVSRAIIVRATDVQKLSNLASNIQPLVGDNYNVISNGLELTYQNLPNTRVSLLSEAVKDAQARAEAVAKQSNRTVGALRSSTGGVVQVLPAGGVDVSDYGTYDTQSMNKEVMVTVRATFSLE